MVSPVKEVLLEVEIEEDGDTAGKGRLEVDVMKGW